MNLLTLLLLAATARAMTTDASSTTASPTEPPDRSEVEAEAPARQTATSTAASWRQIQAYDCGRPSAMKAVHTPPPVANCQDHARATGTKPAHFTVLQRAQAVSVRARVQIKSDGVGQLLWVV